MERRNEECYIAAFDTINSGAGGGMNPAISKTDYEKAVHTAANHSFPIVKTSGCW